MTTNAFYNAMSDNITTANGAVSYAQVDISGKYDGRLSWFFKGIRGLNFVYAASYLENAAKESIVDTFCLVFNTRDVLKGKGERDLGRKALQWLLINYPEQMMRVLYLIPEYGRWDDLYCLFPKALDLSDITWVNNNFCSHVTTNTLEKARQTQKHAITVFKNQLQIDWLAYQNGMPMSLAAKWCETEGSGDDKRYGFVQQICKEWKLHPKGYRVRVGEMRTALNIVEKLCAGKKWNEIDYSKVPSQTMKKLRKAFSKNDPLRFQDWLSKLRTGDPTVKINSKTLHPHELVEQYMSSKDGNVDPVIEEQWKSIENNVRQIGALDKTVVVSDVSGSMFGIFGGSNKSNPKPIHVCIALSILIARTSKAPWNNSVISFSESPHFHTLEKFANQDVTLRSMINDIMNIGTGFNTNFYKVFENIINKHLQYKLKPEDHPERVIVISDMQFDTADSNITNIQAIDDLYKKHGLKRPTLIFWNVDSHLDFPATTQHENTCLIGGFSPSIVSTLTTSKVFSPVYILRDVIDNIRYQDIRIALA